VGGLIKTLPLNNDILVWGLHKVIEPDL